MSESQAESDRTPWEPEQIRALFNEDSELSRIALVYIYTGLRAQELLNVDLDKVDLNEGYLIAGSKTASGKDRYIPIHPAILQIISAYVERGYVFNGSYNKLYAQWAKWTDKLIHECRHTTETELDRAGANRRCIDLILGHKSSEVGQRVYNHKTTSELQEAIRLIPDYRY
jgi:integrase